MSLSKVFFLSSEIEPFSNTYNLSEFSNRFGLLIKTDKEFHYSNLESLWVDVFWDNYGPFGIQNKQDGFVIPISKPKQNDYLTYNKSKESLKDETCILPIKTHILGKLDNPYEVIYDYSSKLIKEGDILTIGETPLAIMQGRYVSPNSIEVSFLAKLLCKGFHPTSSLATACCMQVLINIIGPSRALYSFIFASIFKLFKIKGIFYQYNLKL